MVNFTIILRVAFFAQKFSCLRFSLVLFWRKNIGAKAAPNMLVKLTPRVQILSHFVSISLTSNEILGRILIISEIPGGGGGARSTKNHFIKFDLVFETI
jgi:hypothetical protein